MCQDQNILLSPHSFMHEHSISLSLSPDQILPSLKPREFTNSASLLGAHAEGPYLFPTKKGAHNASLFHMPSTPPSSIYGVSNLPTIKLATIAPELPNSTALIKQLTA